RGGGIVLVEDINSAVKVHEAVQRQQQQLANKVISLNGTSGSASLSLTLIDEDVIVWLDGDSAGQNASIKLIKDLTPLVRSIKVVVGQGDPKDYSYSEIQQILGSNVEGIKIDIQEILKDE
ncbi:MAG: toprim domain-containing protein, partial [Bacteroides sp.]